MAVVPSEFTVPLETPVRLPACTFRESGSDDERIAPLPRVSWPLERSRPRPRAPLGQKAGGAHERLLRGLPYRVDEDRQPLGQMPETGSVS